MKKFNGKAIYNPSGKAGEYAKWACNLYVGCSAKCEYCYCKSLLRGQWSNIPHLKKSLLNKEKAREIFIKEMLLNKVELQKHGLFFNFVSDPCLPETYILNLSCWGDCINNWIPVLILTKQTNWLEDFFDRLHLPQDYKLFAFGYTLTGHDELEPGAATNAERIEAMKKLHDKGFITWASIEPIISIPASYDMIVKTLGFCDLYKIGLQSGKKYDFREIDDFASRVYDLTYNKDHSIKLYFKDSMIKALDIRREDCTQHCVTRDFNIFKNN